MAVNRIVLRRIGHPLASTDGRIQRNRLTLYEKIGTGSHKCNWCPRIVQWYSGVLAGRIPDDYLISDHLDRNPRNDVQENLVPSCWRCNLFRDVDRNPFKADIKAMPNRRHVIPQKYKRVSLPGHPLADGQGCVAEHRLVLWNKIGPGEHLCHWCKERGEERRIAWGVIKTTDGVYMLVPDHLNGIKTDNRPENLVESCTPCNVMRGRKDRVRDDEVFVTKGNAKFRAEARVCGYCGDPFLIRAALLRRRPTAGSFCSHSCTMSATLAREHGHTKATIFGRNNRGNKFKAEERICLGCNEKFLFALSSFAPGKFCSKQCASTYNNRVGLIGNRKVVSTGFLSADPL